MKTFLLSLLALTLVAAPLKAADHDRPLKGLTGAFFALSVANLEESAGWYREKLGLDVVLQVDQGTAVTVLEGEGLTVELIHDPAARPASGQPGSVHGFFKAGFVVKDLGRTLEALKARGVEVAFGPFPAKDGQRANAVIRDNAGNLIQIFGN
jgi:catechol 2,3-dioxygenase-like lactoylglutathione lyase family enzyme